MNRLKANKINSLLINSQCVIFLLVLVFWLCGCNKVVTEDAIYIDKLVYLKKDSTLFTGTLHVLDFQEIVLKITFKDGIPVGEWKGYDNYPSDIHVIGKMLDKQILSEYTVSLIGTKMFYLNHYKEGGPYGVPLLSVGIVKPPTFFKEEKTQYVDYFQKLADEISKDTKHIEYRFLLIDFEDAIFSPQNVYSIEYEIKDGQPFDTGNIREK